MHGTIGRLARLALSLAILATLAACRVEPDGDGDIDAWLDADVETDAEADGDFHCDTCDGIYCGDHGVCTIDHCEAECLCEPAYRSEGLECVPRT